MDVVWAMNQTKGKSWALWLGVVVERVKKQAYYSLRTRPGYTYEQRGPPWR